MLLTCTYRSPIGEIGLLKENDNLIKVSFTDTAFKYLDVINSPNEFKEVITQLNEYFYEGRNKFEIQYTFLSTTFRTDTFLPSNFKYMWLQGWAASLSVFSPTL